MKRKECYELTSSVMNKKNRLKPPWSEELKFSKYHITNYRPFQNRKIHQNGEESSTVNGKDGICGERAVSRNHANERYRWT